MDKKKRKIQFQKVTSVLVYNRKARMECDHNHFERVIHGMVKIAEFVSQSTETIIQVIHYLPLLLPINIDNSGNKIVQNIKVT